MRDEPSAVRRLVTILLGLALFAAFCAHSVLFQSWLVRQMHLSEVLGYDYATFLAQLRSLDWITYTGARHPGLGLVLSPLVCLAHLADCVSVRSGDCVILGFFAALATVNAWFVHRLGGSLALGLWILFGFTWIWASVPESFPVAQCLLLLALLLADSDPEARCGPRRAALLWVLLAVVSSLVTVTNGFKIVLAGFVCSSVFRRHWRRLLVCGAVVGLLTVGFFALRMALWNVHHPEAPKTIAGALGATLSWIPRGLTPSAWAKSVGTNLFVFPTRLGILFRRDLACPPAVSIWNAVGAVLLWLGALAAAVRRRSDPVTRVIAVCFAVDFLIHGVFCWGLAEGWLFSAHYLPFLPILLGRGGASCVGLSRRISR